MPLLLLWLAGAALRLTILAVPPVLPAIHDELHLSATEVGILTGLPSMLFAFAAVPGSLLIARLGLQTALVSGLALCAIAGALRGAFASIWWLDAMTIAMGAGVAVMQVTMPPAVRAWAPSRIPFATALYTNGLLIGEILPVALTLPLVLPLVVTWQRGFVAWSVPVAIIAVMVLLLAPRANAGSATGRRWWPDWHSPLIWRLGLMLGMVNSMYFGTNAFLPGYLTAHGESRMDQRGAHRAQSRAVAGLVPAAGVRRPPAAQGMALRHVRRAVHRRDRRRRARLRHLGGRIRGDDRLCRCLYFDPGAGAAATAGRAGRRASRHCRDVHDQL